jgi:hypothetical protein
MSKKQFEHIENKFREAAENYQPSLNQEAWEKMEVLLDKDLTRKPRAAGFWITSLLLLLIGGGLATYLVTSYLTDKPDTEIVKTAIPSQKLNNPVTAKKNQPTSANQQAPGNVADKKSSTLTNKQQSDPITTGKSGHALMNRKVTSSANRMSPVNSNKIPGGAKQSRISIGANDDSEIQTKRSSSTTAKTTPQTDLNQTITHSSDKNKSKDGEENKNEVANGVHQSTDVVQQGKPSAALSNNKPINKKDIPQAVVSNKQPVAKSEETAAASQSTSELPARSIESRLYFTASVASDANALIGSGTGKVTAMYGIGIGYQVNNRFSIQTGLYGGSKRYSTDAAKGYYLKDGYWRTVNIRNIDADCLIFNVPISVRYNAIRRRAGQWYGIAGISSYFMQKESYDYYYYYTGSSTLQHKKEVYGDNNHLFSVIDLSIGYEHRLSKHLSIQGEPYLKVPMKGVGEGRVHLYSAGLMLGLKLRP